MLITKYVELKWNSKIKKHYVDLGYTFTKMKDTFIVDIRDLTKGSKVKVNVKCDYCQNEYSVEWYSYINKSNTKKDCCGNPQCTGRKAKDCIREKYGVESCRYIEGVNEKIKNTCLKKYGVENPFQSTDIKNKIIKNNLEKYGVEYANQRKDVADKKSNSMKEYCMKHPNRYVKENSPRWKGGVEYSRVERATYEYNQWRKSVFERDNYTCQCCLKRGGITLNAHHIQNWKDNIDKRYDIDNGITLCNKCHNKFHSKYGKHNNTKIQIQEFLDENIC